MGENANKEKELLLQMAKGDEDAFRILFDLYKNRLFVFVEQLIHSRADTEEIIQDTFLKVWQSAAMIAKIEQPGHYIYTIARNKTLNHMRTIARNRHLIDQIWANQQETDHSLEERLRTQEYQELIEQAVSQLPAQKQTIFRLSRQQGLNHTEIAVQLGLSQSRVKNIIVEILKHIKAYLQEHSDLLAILFWINVWEQMF